MSTLVCSPRRASVLDPGKLAPVILLGLCAFLFLYGINEGDLYRTESLRAIIAQEFLNSGNWIVPTLYGEPLLTKPPGMYAAIALASWPFGEVTTWSARLPSALAATATVLLMYWSFRRHFGSSGGLIAAIITPTMPMWLDKGTAAEIDMLQVFWVTGAILLFLRALEEEDVGQGRSAFRWWLGALLFMAGGVLTKWTAVAFFYGTVVPLLWWRGRLSLLWGRNHLLTAGLSLLVCLGWAGLAVAQVGWATLADTVGQEALQRIVPREIPVEAVHHHHRPYPWLETLGHPFVILVCTLPWSLGALLTLRRGFAAGWDEGERRLLQGLHCWVWPNLLFWTLIPEHAPRHSFPLAPGVAGLAAFVWIGWLSGRRLWHPRGIRPVTIFLGFLVIWIGIKLAFVHMVLPARNSMREPLTTGQILARHVPADHTLYLAQVKDEGIMFYYGQTRSPGEARRSVRRVKSFDLLPSSSELVYCILTAEEWQRWRGEREAEVVLRLRDQQGDPLLLVRVGAAGGPR